MSRSSEPGERVQHSVAELLARYGEPVPTTGRRRRRAPESDETDPRSIIDRIRTGGEELRSDPDGPGWGRAADQDSDRGFLAGRTGPGLGGISPHREDGAAGHNGFPGFAGYPGGGTNGHFHNGYGSPDTADRAVPGDDRGPGPRSFGTTSWTERDTGGPGPAAVDFQEWRPAVGDTAPGPNGAAGGVANGGPRSDTFRPAVSSSEDTWAAQPPFAAANRPLGAHGVGIDDGPVTDQIPRVPAPEEDAPEAAPEAAQDSGASGTASGPDDWTNRLAGGEPPAGLGTGTRFQPVPDAGGDRTDGYPGYGYDNAPTEVGGALTALDDGPEAGGYDHTGYDHTGYGAAGEDHRLDGAVDDQDADADEEAEQARSPMREWFVMASQIGVGVVGGAVLWLICEWLWQRIPVVALIVALAVITGLVWLVRHVRKAEDLQTTVIAVLVGLFVTVSPAALLLVGR